MKVTTNEDMVNLNRALILQYIQQNGICTRANISKAIGLTSASISKIISGLLKDGLVEEKGYVVGKKGRRSVGIAIRKDIKKVLGVKFSKRSISLGVFDVSGATYDIHVENIEEDNNFYEIIERIKSLLKQYIDSFDIAAIGIAVPGPFIKKEGILHLMTGIANGKDIPIKHFLQESIDIPIVVCHNANAGALADWWFGSYFSGDKKGTLIHFIVGEGVGAGIIVDGKILEGDQGIAGEIGHISIDVNGKKCNCGNYGCLERYCSSVDFVKYATDMRTKDPSSVLNRYKELDLEIILKAANEEKDMLAIELVKSVGKYIGYGVITLIYSYNPSIIVISNEMAKGGELLLNSVKKVVKERVDRSIYENVEIKLSDFINQDSILYGAAAVAIDYCLKNPSLLMRT